MFSPFSHLNSAKSPGKRPPGPGSWLLLQALRDWPYNFLPTLARIAREYGDVVRMSFGLETRYLVNHPDYIKYIAEDHKDNYQKDSPDNDLLKQLIGEGLVTSHGELWQRQRRHSSPAFQRQRLETYAQPMVAATLAMLDRWQPVAHQGGTLNLNKQMRYLTLNIINQTLFGQPPDEARTFALEKAFSDLNREATHNPALMRFPRLPTLGNLRLQTAINRIDEIVAEMIRAGRQRPEGADDLLAMLLAPDEKSGLAMAEAQVRDQLRLLLLAGHQTTADTLAWAWYLLDSHPEVAAQLQAELDTVLGGRPPTLEDLPHLVYTQRVMEETLRLCPPIWVVPRLTYASDTIGGYYLPARSGVWVSPYLIQRHPEFWPQPDIFDPDRFLPEQVANRPRHAYIPFGLGHRLCLGDNFAMLEMRLVIATVAQRYTLRMVPGQQLKLKPLMTIHPAVELHMQPQARTSD